VVLTEALIMVAGCVSEPESEPLDLSGTSEPADLTYYTEQLPPSNYQENGTLQGISVDLLEAIKVLFAKPDIGITIENSENLKGYRIEVITDNIAIQHLLGIGVNESQIVPESNVSTIIMALDKGEIDLWACPEASGRYFTEQTTGNNSHFTVVYQLHTQDLYYAFSKDIPDSRVRSFQQALDDIKQEKDTEGISEYERILGQYLSAIDLA